MATIEKIQSGLDVSLGPSLALGGFGSEAFPCRVILCFSDIVFFFLVVLTTDDADGNGLASTEILEEAKVMRNEGHLRSAITTF